MSKEFCCIFTYLFSEKKGEKCKTIFTTCFTQKSGEKCENNGVAFVSRETPIIYTHWRAGIEVKNVKPFPPLFSVEEMQ
jgi:hypothetical protein